MEEAKMYLKIKSEDRSPLGNDECHHILDCIYNVISLKFKDLDENGRC